MDANLQTRRKAIAYRKGELSVIPIKANGEKRPYSRYLPDNSWDQFAARLPSGDELARMFPGDEEMGIAILGGKASRGLEIIDVDDGASWMKYQQLVEEERPGLLDRLPQVLSPRQGGGRHIYLRSDSPDGNLVLARKDIDGKPKTLIETRGQGGYVLAPGGHPDCHDAKKEYRHVAGPQIEETPKVNSEEREILFTCAQSLNEYEPREEYFDAGEHKQQNSNSPGNIYMRTEGAKGFVELLKRYGWTLLNQRGEHIEWRRPGKDAGGLSAVTGYVSESGNPLMIVFTSNAPPFEGRRTVRREDGKIEHRTGGCYNLFTAYAMLEHKGKYERAALRLAKKYTPTKCKRQINSSLQRLSDVKTEPVRWVWKDCLAVGKLAILQGDPGLGKGHIGIDFAARISTGTDWPDGEPCELGEVIILSGEDYLSDTIKPRLEAAGADCKRVFAIKSTVKLDDEIRTVDLEQDIPRIIEIFESRPDCQLLIIDPVMAFLGDADSHKDAEVRSILTPLADAAAEHRVAILGVLHLNKQSKGPAIYRGMGSVAFTAAARIVWAISKDEQPGRRLLTCVKSNIGADVEGFAFSLVNSDIPDYMRIEWEKERITVSADEALGDPESRSVLEDAEGWLREYLADGPIRSTEVRKDARENGHAFRTLQRAFRKLGGKAEKLANYWQWELPPDPKRKQKLQSSAQPAQNITREY